MPPPVNDLSPAESDAARLDWIQTLDVEDFTALADFYWEAKRDIRKAIDTMKREKEEARAEVEPFES